MGEGRRGGGDRGRGGEREVDRKRGEWVPASASAAVASHQDPMVRYISVGLS